MAFSRGHVAARERIRRLCYDGLTSPALRVAIVRELSHVTPIRGAFFPTVDPTTLLYTSAVREGMPADVTPRYIDNEFRVDDVNKFRNLARSVRAAVTLDDATEGNWSTSTRSREIMTPYGYGDELRAAFRTGGATWGFLCLHRQADADAFTAADVELVASVSTHIAEGLRRATIVDVAATSTAADGPGVVTIAPDLSIVAATAAGQRWLADLAAADRPASQPLPVAVNNVVSALSEVGAHSTATPHLSARGASGQWLSLHASHLTGAPGGGTVAVVIEPATPLLLQPLIVAAYALSAREAQICALVLRGLATKTIARELRISVHTVNDHLKAIFNKTGVSTRGELMASVFQQHYAPPPAR
ncbi:MAG: Transcriptional regulator, LuxR family [Acidimicrobiales bacterium]|nr:Transcriptional regulator, LuxR family [Acidimicrobiales bacterium]